MKHLKYFPDSQIIGGGVKVDLPNISYLKGKNVLFIPGNDGQATVKVNSNTGKIEVEKPDYSQMYLTFEAIESGTFKFSGATSAHTLSYSLDDGATWTSLAHNTDTPTINVGNKIMWKGNLRPKTSKGIGTFVATGKFDVCGNIMSLLYGDDFVWLTSFDTFAFYELFKGNSKVVSAQNLILPATTLADYCYYGMFVGCKSLTTAPALPATTLAEYCYGSMFRGCTSLATAPALPATTLAEYCYGSMFEGCTSLTTAPELPATTLVKGCYEYMFYDCTSLTIAPELPATTLAESCYNSMFKDCTSLTTAPALPATTLASGCYGNMFYGCTGLTTAPLLPAAVLVDMCYNGMFYSCKSLTTAPDLSVTTIGMMSCMYMFKECTLLNHITLLTTSSVDEMGLMEWVDGVAPSGTFVKSVNVAIPSGTSGIPNGWTVVEV